CPAARRRHAIVQTSFVDLVVLAEEFHPIPFRTRPLKPPAPMVLRLKTRESRSLPGLQRTIASRSERARRPAKARTRERERQKRIRSQEHPAITNLRKPRERNLAGLL